MSTAVKKMINAMIKFIPQYFLEIDDTSNKNQNQ